MGKKKSIIRQLKEFEERVSREIPISKIVFFGSRAKGRPRRTSDVDLIVVSKEFKSMNFIERAAKLYDYWNLAYPVDFLCYTPREFERLKKRVSIVKEALEEGVAI